MKKLKEKNTINLINYQHFLKNNNLKKTQFKLKNILFENQILLKKNNLFLIELNDKENILVPIKNNQNNQSIIYTIKKKYENYLLLNYSFNYNILYHFTKILFKNKIKKTKDIIKARIIGGNKKKIIVSIYGLLISTKPKELFKGKKLFYGSKLKSVKVIFYYKLKYLNFKIKKYLKKKKSILSRKLYVRKTNEKIKK